MKMNLTDPRALAEFERAYIGCMLWSSNDESREDGGDPLDDNYGPEDLAEETRIKIAHDCMWFVEMLKRDRGLEVLPGWSAAYAGHDFWLTRNGHGCGFWDRYWKAEDEDLKALGDWMSERVGWRTEFPEQSPYVGDDGKIYI